MILRETIRIVANFGETFFSANLACFINPDTGLLVICITEQVIN